MEIRVWQAIDVKGGCVLAVRGDQVVLLIITGMGFQKKTPAVAQQIANGSDPMSLGAKAYSLPLASIRQIEVPQSDGSIIIKSDGPGKTNKIWFQPLGGDDGKTIAREIVRLTGARFFERKREEGIISSLLSIFIYALITGALWVALYLITAEMEAGKTFTPSGYKKGLKTLFVSLGALLGTKGVIILGVVLLAGFIGWGFYRLKNRPLEIVWDRY